jgi:hypothetical protein
MKRKRTRKKRNVSTKLPTTRTAVLVFLLAALFLHTSFLFAGDDKDLRKHFGLISGTAWGPDGRFLPGVKIKIHPVGKKNPHWDVISDDRGEFHQRVPPGSGDYVVTGEVVVVPTVNGVARKKEKLRGERTVHISGEELEDIGLHLEVAE